MTDATTTALKGAVSIEQFPFPDSKWFLSTNQILLREVFIVVFALLHLGLGFAEETPHLSANPFHFLLLVIPGHSLLPRGILAIPSHSLLPRGIVHQLVEFEVLSHCDILRRVWNILVRHILENLLCFFEFINILGDDL